MNKSHWLHKTHVLRFEDKYIREVNMVKHVDQAVIKTLHALKGLETHKGLCSRRQLPNKRSPWGQREQVR